MASSTGQSYLRDRRKAHLSVRFLYSFVEIGTCPDIIHLLRYLISFGGTDYQYHYNDTWMFSLASHTWTEVNAVGYFPSPTEGHTAVTVGDDMYVYGGRGLDGVESDYLGSFNIRREWNRND